MKIVIHGNIMLIELAKDIKTNEEIPIEYPWIGNYVGNTNRLKELALTGVRLDSAQYNLSLRNANGIRAILSRKKIPKNKIHYTGVEILFSNSSSVFFFQHDIHYIPRAMIIATDSCIMSIGKVNFELKKNTFHELRIAKNNCYAFREHYELHGDSKT